MAPRARPTAPRPRAPFSHNAQNQKRLAAPWWGTTSLTEEMSRMTDTPKPVAQDTPSAQPRELSFSDLEPWLEWPTGARLLPDIDPETALARIEQAFGLKRGALLERLALDAALRSAQQVLGPPKLRGMEICRDGLGISEEALRAASDPKSCPVCKRPGHATETDEYGRHRECQGADAATNEGGEEVQP